MTTEKETATPDVTISLVNGLKFVAKTKMGNEIWVEPSPQLGGSGTIPNPVEYYVAAIGGCAAIKTQIDLCAINMLPKSMNVDVSCTRRETYPQILEAIEVMFTLKGNLDESKVGEVIDSVMTSHCPIAVMAAASAKVTWGYRIIRN